MIVGKPKTVLVTRPEPMADATAQKLRILGFLPVILPLTETVALPVEKPFAKVDAVIATSSAVFLHMTDALFEHIRSLPLYCVGLKTAQTAVEKGMETVLCHLPTAADLVDKTAVLLPQHFLYLAGRLRRDTLSRCLPQQGHQLTMIEVYDTRSCSLDEDVLINLSQQIDFCLVYSGYAAQMINVIDMQYRSSMKFICLSQRIADQLPQDVRSSAFVSATPDEESALVLLSSISR